MSILGLRRLVIKESCSDPGGGLQGGARTSEAGLQPATSKISGQTRSRCNAEMCGAHFGWTAKKEPHRGLQQKSSNQSLDPVGHTSVHFPGLSNYSALFARAAFLAARSGCLGPDREGMKPGSAVIEPRPVQGSYLEACFRKLNQLLAETHPQRFRHET